ncbi:MAG: hypothetical protein OHK006_15390 [Thermodesulfovibrionales bacterium]
MPEGGGRVRTGEFATALLVIALSVLAAARNEVWRSDLLLWSDNVSKSPQKARAHYNLGVILLEADRTEEAQSRFAEALRLNPRYTDAYVNIGKVYVRLKKPQRAKEAFKTALLLDPGNVLAHFNLGVAYLDDGMNDEADREFETVLRIQPSHAQARQFLLYLRMPGNSPPNRLLR